MPPDDWQRVGVDGERLCRLPQFRAGLISLEIEAVLWTAQGSAWWCVGHTRAPAALHPAQLFPTRAPGRDSRIPDLRGPLNSPNCARDLADRAASPIAKLPVN